MLPACRWMPQPSGEVVVLRPIAVEAPWAAVCCTGLSTGTIVTKLSMGYAGTSVAAVEPARDTPAGAAARQKCALGVVAEVEQVVPKSDGSLKSLRTSSRRWLAEAEVRNQRGVNAFVAAGKALARGNSRNNRTVEPHQ